MGLLSALISVEKMSDEFIALFNKYLSNEQINGLLNECTNMYMEERNVASFAEICTMKIVQSYRDFLIKRKMEGKNYNSASCISQFLGTNFDRELAVYIKQHVAGKSIVDMIRVSKNGKEDFGSIIVIFSAAVHTNDRKSKEYLTKQISVIDSQVLTVLRAVTNMGISDYDFDEYLNRQAPKEESDGFSFQNIYEYLLYLGKKASEDDLKESYIWKNADQYNKTYYSAYQEMEKSNPEKAIQLLNKCLEMNPIGIQARFEMAEAFILQKDYANAKKCLEDVTEFICSKNEVARYYRRNGFIAIEEKNYELAEACFKYSLNFEKNDVANDELLYLRTLVGNSDIDQNNEDLLLSNGLVVFKKDLIEQNVDNLTGNIPMEKSIEIYQTVQNNKLKKETGVNAESIDTTLESDNEEHLEAETVDKLPDSIEENALEEQIIEETPEESFNTESMIELEQDTNVPEAPVTEKYEDIESIEPGDELEPIDMERPKFCKKCGAELFEGSLFCRKCGTKISD